MVLQRWFCSTLFLVLVCCGGLPALGSDTPGEVDNDAMATTPTPEPSQPTTLYLAAHANDISIVEDMLAKGAEVDAILQNGATPLWIAASMGHVQIVNVLLRAGADVSRTVNPVIKTPTTFFLLPTRGTETVFFCCYARDVCPHWLGNRKNVLCGGSRAV
jgi:hypothetical protein